jgi:hypothetical protein
MTFVAGSFFHDWSEAQSLSILRNCRRAMSPDSRVLIIEMVLPEGNTFHPGKMLDMTMLATTLGQERTEHEYRMLREKAGFKISRVIPTISSVSIIEAIPA